MRDYEDSGMRAMLIKKLNGQADEVVSVSCYKTSAFGCSPIKLFFVRSLHHAGFMGAYSIYMLLPKYLCDLWAEVFIKIVFQSLPPARKGYLL